jgi:hypothetical protein
VLAQVSGRFSGLAISKLAKVKNWQITLQTQPFLQAVLYGKYCCLYLIYHFSKLSRENISDNAMLTFNAGIEIKAMKNLTLHHIALTLHRFWCPALLTN